MKIAEWNGECPKCGTHQKPKQIKRVDKVGNATCIQYNLVCLTCEQYFIVNLTYKVIATNLMIPYYCIDCGEHFELPMNNLHEYMVCHQCNGTAIYKWITPDPILTRNSY